METNTQKRESRDAKCLAFITGKFSGLYAAKSVLVEAMQGTCPVEAIHLEQSIKVIDELLTHAYEARKELKAELGESSV